MPPVLVHRRSVPVTGCIDHHGGATRYWPRSIRVGAASCFEDGLRFVAEVPSHNRCQGGRIVETWGQVDNLGLLQQLGVVPAMG